MIINTKLTSLIGLDVQGQRVNGYYGRRQMQILELLPSSISAIRINGMIFVPIRDLELERNLNHEWETGTPADDVIAVQKNSLFQDKRVVTFE